MPTDPTLNVTRVDDVTVIGFPHASREINQLVLDRISDPMLNAINADAPRVLLDLDGIKFFGSSFIELMFRLWNRVRGRAGGEFALCNVAPYCREVLDLTNLSRVWPIFDSRQSAIDALHSDINAWSSTV